MSSRHKSPTTNATHWHRVAFCGLGIFVVAGCSISSSKNQSTEAIVAETGEAAPAPVKMKEKDGQSKAATFTFPASKLTLARTILAKDLFDPKDVAGLHYNVRISGVLPLMQQGKSNRCWATASAMLASWKSGQTTTPADYIANLGEPYAFLYENDNGLHREQKEAFLKRAGLTFEWGASYHPDGIAKMLKDFGPLWFTINMRGEFSPHASVIVGLFGTGEMKSTYVVYADPADGKEHALLYPDYMKVYEDVAWDKQSVNDLEENFQVVHYP